MKSQLPLAEAYDVAAALIDMLRLTDTDTIIPTPSEDDVFRLAGIPFIPPEKREN